MSLTHAQIEAVAPDQASLSAARKLLKANKWPLLAYDDEAQVIFGDCQGSGAAPYRVAVDLGDLVAKCTCPSRKFPCKHGLALMWWFADDPARFSAQATVPEWASDWLTRRRQRPGPTTVSRAPGARPTLAATAADDAPKALDDKQAARAARSRERQRAKREAAILEGLDELDRWIGDVLQQGLAAFPAHAAQQCSMLARRLVDAKAGGLAKRLESFPSIYFDTPEPERADVLIESLGALHLLAAAYRRQAHLSAPLRAEVRRLVGWTQTREELLASAQVLRASGRWFVLAVRRQTQPDRLVRIETWLHRVDAIEGEETPCAAVLMDFIPVAMASNTAAPYARGQTVEATLAFYPSATPLIALVAEHRTSGVDGPLPRPKDNLRTALEDYRQHLAKSPWLNQWPIAFHHVTLRRDHQGCYWFCSHQSPDEIALRVHPDAHESVSTLAGLSPVGVYALHDGRHCWPLAATTALGPWWGASDG